MDQGPLVTEQIEAGAAFLAEFAKTFPILAAFWLKVGEDDSWYLHVSSERIGDDTIGEAYREVLRIAGEMRDPNFDPFQVKVIKPGNRLARAAADRRRLCPGPKPIRLRGRIFGGMGAEDIYIYPTLVVVS